MELTLDIGYIKNLLYKNASISLKETEVLSFVGDNGSGKSILYKTILGIIPPLKGSVPQDIKVNAGIVSDYVQLPGEVKFKNIVDLLCESQASYAKQYYPVLNKYVSNFSSKKINALSSGQRRIVEIYVVLASGKRIVILDEASNSLDYKNRKLFLNQVKELSSKILFLHTSHDLEDVVDLGGQVYGLFKERKQIKKYSGENSVDRIREFLNYEVLQ